VVYRWEAPLFFANAGTFRQQVRSLVREKGARWVVLQCEALTDIDVTAAAMLEEADKQLNRQGVRLAFVELRTRLQDLVQLYGLLETLSEEHFYPTMDAALTGIAAADADERQEDGEPGEAGPSAP
jgi:anti-anti-sigma factor